MHYRQCNCWSEADTKDKEEMKTFNGWWCQWPFEHGLLTYYFMQSSYHLLFI